MTSLWLDRAAPVADEPLPDPGEALDALVVGAGLTGLTTSLLLARAGCGSPASRPARSAR